jgi:hypothetical protein
MWRNAWDDGAHCPCAARHAVFIPRIAFLAYRIPLRERTKDATHKRQIKKKSI